MSTYTSTDMPAGLGERRPSGLLAAFLVALGLHACVLAAVMLLRLSPPAPPGEQQITVDLAPLMTDAATEAPAEQQMSQEAPPETKPVDAPPDEAVQPPPTEMTEVNPEDTQAVEMPQEAQPVEAQSQVITSASEAAEPLAPPPTEVAKTEEPPKPTPDPAKLKAEREAKLRKVREEKLREQKREEARQERLEEIREAKAKAAREAKAREAKARAGAERSSASASRENAAGRAAAGNDPSAMRQWQGAISAAIHSRMNVNAAVGTGGGTAVVRFTVMRSGQVTGAGVARSSGVGQIDSAALAAVRGSMPAAPSGVTQSSLSISIPLNFRVR
ncbi:cell envelope integrity protein TolA [Methylobacterium sp. NMS14P]|uniref:cell envelope integrity protein TolA n=1 Tax=Methylobacterium sp. NMS14P TaxID=2894310 RepID=UPI00235A16C2|nr:cell envelope integrity protein TolA [Methylobacterium sp. NMS14P]WCS22896.1 cell envelope integrity protein TolA [Methylobacterium sp. NMS14P]